MIDKKLKLGTLSSTPNVPSTQLASPQTQTVPTPVDSFQGQRLTSPGHLLRLGQQAASALGTAAHNLWDANLTQIDGPTFANEIAELASRRPPDFTASANALQDILTARGTSADACRTLLAEKLVGGFSAGEMGQLVDAYIQRFGRHPEFDIRSDGLGQPLQKLKPEDELQLAGIVSRASMRETAKTLSEMLAKPQLDLKDRQTFMSMLPMLGLWAMPTRSVNDRNLDSPERQFLLAAWKEVTGDVPLDVALARIEAKAASVEVPPPSLPREKSIALLASSQGAQWQETMDFALEMKRQGYDVRVFTPDGPDGRTTPVGFQRDSLLVSEGTTELGLGAPQRLNPRDPSVAREIAELLGNTQRASELDASKVGMVYLAGGLGFNEDVARATELSAAEQLKLSEEEKAVYQKHGTVPVKLELNKSVEGFMAKAVNSQLPFVTLCHGATAFAATQVQVEVDGKVITEAFNKNLLTSSLPPFEAYVRFRDSVGAQFLYGSPNVDTHQVMLNAGGKADAAADALDMSGMSIDYRPLKRDAEGRGIPGSGFLVLSGPGPQTARNLALEVLRRDENEGFLKR